MKKAILPLILILICSTSGMAQYLQRSGKYIVDPDGSEFIVRGMGLGGWMLQEGYMLGTGSFAGTQHEIRALIEASMGKERTDEFYDAWLANHCTKTDIDSLASWGFNAVRPALHYNLFTLPIEDEPVAGQDTWLEKGFQMVDELVEWCKPHNMYVILDLHAAPGGQGKDGNISDYDQSKPSLWESEENQRKTVALWRKLAERYANEKYIGGYDLINETNWNFNGTHQNGCDSSNEKLRELMIRITDAIREVDQNHILFIEGNCWANNMNGLLPPWDDNMAYSFHKYWNATDAGTIAEFIGYRNQYNVPMWLGESGENSNQWFMETIKMLESQKVGWSWWPVKKIGSVVCPAGVVQTPEYDQLLKTWSDGGTPDPDFCYETLMQITENLMMENCEYHPDVIDAMFRQRSEKTPIPYKQLEIPGVIHTVDYDMGSHSIAYEDADYTNTGGNGSTDWNQGWTYRNDGVDIKKTTDESELSNGYNVGWTNAGEWMLYTVNVKQAGAYEVTFRIQGTIGNFHLEVNGKNISGDVAVNSSDNYWKDLTIENIILEEGIQQLKFYIDKGGFNINYLKFANPGPTGDVPSKLMNGFASPTGAAIHLACNKQLDPVIIPETSSFRLKVNGFIEQIDQLSYDTQDPSILILKLKKKVYPTDQVVLTYTPGLLQSVDGDLVNGLINMPIALGTINTFAIPGKIEAEDYETNVGWLIENCSDDGGGYDMGHTDDGDYLDYRVEVDQAGKYQFDFRVAAGYTSGGYIDLQLLTEIGTTNLISFFVPGTDDWQNWITLSKEVTLPEGINTLRVLVNKKEFNLNWINTELILATASEDIIKQELSFSIYPNPANHQLMVKYLANSTDNYLLTVRNMLGEILQSTKVSGSMNELNLNNLKNGLYLIQLIDKGRQTSQPFLILN
ncbi:carbohydrate-binding protein [Mangrovibacterium lignilyticum]|uniref:carbohydrate-binding protein n=1 Tax=Mangrovibacterium lignilyticum TaxID=2668052 RepID=UPI0013D3444F|nr:carbohydrate-binding protein [Mangrovibacterium lignilyticum]